MKKFLAAVLTVCILASALSVSSFAALTSTEIYSAYDYNNDGVVDLSDARIVLRVSAGIEAPIDGKDYDVDKSGSAEPGYNDVKAVLCIALGISTDGVDVSSDEYILSLFRKELNSIKDVRPGFTKNTVATCKSVLVTTRNAPDSSLNVTDMEFSEYSEKTCKYLEDLLKNPLFWAYKAEGEAKIAEIRQGAKDVYVPQKATKTVAKRTSAHYTEFPINNLGYCCYLETSDIQSIESYEEGDYIIRKVTMKTDTYVGDEYPTGTAGFKDRYQKIPYGKVFNIPALSEIDGSVVNKVVFSDGVITIKTDKLTGIPVNIDYKYTYMADVASPVEIDEEGNPGIEMTKKATVTMEESYKINPVEVN